MLLVTRYAGFEFFLEPCFTKRNYFQFCVDILGDKFPLFMPKAGVNCPGISDITSGQDCKEEREVYYCEDM